MHPLPLPSIEAQELYANSCSKIRVASLRERHLDETPNISVSAKQFTDAARDDRVDQLASDEFQPFYVSKTEMSDLYDKRVQPSTSPGRPHYDKLISAAPHNRCPYCGERRVKSIDHYLPKKTFSSLAVTPTNLVPACSDCNHAKGAYQPSDTDPPILHPYFDNVESFRWLYAQVEPSRPPAIRFEVSPLNVPDQRTYDRLQKHFKLFKLADLFRSHAGQAVDELAHRLPPVFANGQSSSVRQYLLEEAVHRSVGRRNSWQRALFEGLAASDWYCNEYFA